jgi:hypothetical protein
VYVTQSTITDNPSGTLVTVYATLKLAVTDFGESITTVPTAPPAPAPDPAVTGLPVQLANAYPAFARVAVTVTASFNAYQLWSPVTSFAAGVSVNVPAPDGFTNPVTACCVPNVTVYVAAVEGAVTV